MELRKGEKDENGKTQGSSLYSTHASGIVQCNHFGKQFNSSLKN